MSDTYKKILRAITALAIKGRAAPVPERVIAKNIAAAAGISRATFYRYLKNHPELQCKYNDIDKPRQLIVRGIRPRGDNLQEALMEIERLRKEVSSARSERDEIARTKNAQIVLLWSECKRLREQLGDPGADSGSNIVPMPKTPG
jgi:AcrR family transcriptional regulator